MTRRRLVFLIQIGISALLVAYLINKIDLHSTGKAVKAVNLGLLFTGAAQLLFQPVLGGIRWAFAVRALGRRLSMSTSIRFSWIGTFFSQALPASVGGDVMRMWLLWRNGVERRIAINSVLIERAIMLMSLLLLIAVLQPGLKARIPSLAATWLPVWMLALALGATAILLTVTALPSHFSRWLPVRAIASIAVDLKKVLSDPLVTALVIVSSILACLNMAIAVWLIALALNIEVGINDCIVLMPVVIFAATLPVSVGGWGVREGTMVALFSYVGVDSGSALALSILFGVAGIVISLPGVALWMGLGYKQRDLTAAASLAEQDLQRD